MKEKLREIVLGILFEQGSQFLLNYKDEKELQENLKKFSNRFCDSVKLSLDINQEIDFAGLENFVLNEHYQELKESYGLQESQKKQYWIESFCSRAFEETSVERKEQREIVSSYITVIMELTEKFYIRRNKKEVLVLAEKTKEETVKDVVREVVKEVEKILERIEKNSSIAVSDSPKPEKREKIRICSFTPKGDEPKVEYLWDFSDRFQDERFLKEGCSWDDIYKEIQEKVNKLDKTKQYEVDFAALYSIAFMAGRKMDSISAIAHIPYQNTFKGRVDFSAETGEDGEGWECGPCTIIKEGQNDFAVSIGLSTQIKGSVERYIKEKNLPIGEVYHFMFSDPDNGCVKSGKHLEQLVKKVNQCIKNRWDENERGMLHLFIAGPVTFMFELGKRSSTYKNIQIYEFNKHGLPQYPKSYYLGWKCTNSKS